MRKLMCDYMLLFEIMPRFVYPFLAVPVCFALTSNRRHETYEAMFRCLNRTASRMNIDFNPTTVVCDFEQAFINGVNKEVLFLYGIMKEFFCIFIISCLMPLLLVVGFISASRAIGTYKHSVSCRCTMIIVNHGNYCATSWL